MANNTNIQFYKDTRLVFETPNGEAKTALGSANDTVQGFEIEYNLSTTPEAFKISPLGINYTSGATDDTTDLSRLAQVGSLLQSLETPKDSTTLQVDKKILLTDGGGGGGPGPGPGGVSAGSIGISGTNLLIDATSDLILDPSGGFVDLSGDILDMNNGQISNCSLLQGENNINIIVEGKETGSVILKTGGIDRIDISDTGSIDFGGMTYNNTTDTLTATNFIGSSFENVTNSVNTDNVLVTPDSTSGNNRLTLAKLDVTGQQSLFMDTGSPNSYNQSTGIFTFSVPPTCSVAATSVNNLVNFNNFNSGSYTPVLNSSGLGTASYNIQTGAFIKINKICFVQLELELNDISSLGAGGLSITLPFPGVGAAGSVVGSFGGLASTAAEVSASTTRTFLLRVALAIRRTLTEAPSSLLKSDITSSFKIRLGFCYFVN
jgi:hypothetical protein